MEAFGFTIIKRQESHTGHEKIYLTGLAVWPCKHYQITQTNSVSEIRLRNHVLHNFSACISEVLLNFLFQLKQTPATFLVALHQSKTGVRGTGSFRLFQRQLGITGTVAKHFYLRILLAKCYLQPSVLFIILSHYVLSRDAIFKMGWEHLILVELDLAFKTFI